MADEMEYLQPDFDPSSLTMPRLRNLFVTHDIQFPASAKKNDLVNIFNEQLRPQAKKLLAARDRVRRTSRGITDMPSSHEGTVNGDTEDEEDAPRTVQRKVRKASPAEGNDAPTTATRATAKKRSSMKPARLVVAEAESSPVKASEFRKSRKSEPASRVELREHDENTAGLSIPDTPFSSDNPFQRGSSPPTATADRRKSAEPRAEKRKSTTARRRTDGVLSDLSRDTQALTAPLNKSKAMTSSLSTDQDLSDAVLAGEEFAPEEQAELDRQRRSGAEHRRTSVRRLKRPVKPPSNIPKSMPYMVLTALLGGYATFYRQEKVSVGYCGVGSPSTSFLTDSRLPNWTRNLCPSCEPCPQHATCFENMEIECQPGFLLNSHPLSIGGLIPLPPSCEPDGEKARKVKAVADRAVEELRERRAEAECGTSGKGKAVANSPEMLEEDLKAVVAQKRRKGMTEAEFDNLWNGALGEMMGRDEVVSDADATRLASTSLVRLPIICIIKRSARRTLARYRGTISIMISMMVLFIYARYRFRRHRAEVAQVPVLVATTLDRLATQAALYTRGDSVESWISVGQLRDDVLRDEFNSQRREAVWARVRAVVEANANVRASTRELRSGDLSRVWEWIGSIAFFDPSTTNTPRSSLGPGRLSSGGADSSFLGDGGDKGIKMEAETSPKGEGLSGLLETRQWNEGRPVY